MEDTVGSNLDLAKASNSDRSPSWPHLPPQHLRTAPPPLWTILDGGILFFLVFPILLRLTKRLRSVGKFFLAEPRYGKTHAFLVPALELPFSCLTTPSNETSPGEKTLKNIHVPPSSTTYFHHFRRNLLCNPNDNKHSQLTHPAPLLRRYRHVSHQTPKHPDAIVRISVMDISMMVT